jgi:cyclohexa-1,5-dienecarbonyl-CoA hydratase
VTAGGIALRVFETGRADLEIRLPPVNVLRLADLEAIAAVVPRAASSRVLVLTGLPRAFSAGVSVAEHVPEHALIERMLMAMRGALEALLDAPAVTVAAVSGACLGGGAEIAAACDLVLCAADARVGFPEIRLACFPPGAAALLPGRVGEARAADWILTGRTVSGREAAEAGFATRAVEPAALASETDRLAAQLLSRGAAALSAARELARTGRRRALASILPRAEEAYRALAGDAELARAVREFSEGGTQRP